LFFAFSHLRAFLKHIIFPAGTVGKYLTFFAILLFSNLFGYWDDYEGEKLVLFTLAPGIGDQFPASCQEQMLPSYFHRLACQFPNINAKVIAIDVCLSEDPKSSEYTFLSEWQNKGVTFRKDNIEIQCYKELIPHDEESEYGKRVEDYIEKVLAAGGVVFIGHHAQAYYAFEPFRIAYNKFKGDNLQMYICYADFPPWSAPKVYFNKPCSNDELEEIYQIMRRYIEFFFDFADKGDREAAYQLLQSIINRLDLNFIFYRDMSDLPYEVIRHSD
jgi:hypothetical protein